MTTPRDLGDSREYGNGRIEAWISDIDYSPQRRIDWAVVDFETTQGDIDGEARLRREGADDTDDRDTVHLREEYPPTDLGENGTNRAVFGSVTSTPGAEGQELVVEVGGDEIARYSRDDLKRVDELTE